MGGWFTLGDALRLPLAGRRDGETSASRGRNTRPGFCYARPHCASRNSFSRYVCEARWL